MNKNYIFVGVIGAALLVAAIANVISPEEFGRDDYRVKVSYDSEEDMYDRARHGRGSGSTVKFNGKHYKCDEETGSVVLEHEDGSTTTVTCG